MPNADRAAVAREVIGKVTRVLRETAYPLSGTTAAQLVEQYVGPDYPAPPAPGTVRVGDDVYSRRGDTWYVGGFNIGLTLRHRELLDRIASDARVLKERDAQIAELEKALEEQPSKLYDSMWQAIDRMGDAVGATTGPGSNCHVTARRVCETIETLKSERDAANARIAELENELRRALDGTVFHEKQAHEARAERDAALRALERERAANDTRIEYGTEPRGVVISGTLEEGA